MIIVLIAIVTVVSEAQTPSPKPTFAIITHPPIEKDLVSLRFSEKMLTVTVEVKGDKSLEVKPPTTWTKSPGWKIKNEQPPTVPSDTEPIWRQTFQLDPVAPGEQQVQLEPVLYREGAGSWQQHDWPLFTVQVSTQLARPDLKSLRDNSSIENPPEVPPADSWLPLGLRILATFLGILLLGLMWHFWRMRKTRRRTPERTALYELGRLKALGLPNKGQVEEFHTLLANVVRRYLQKKYDIPARRMTTQEFGSLLDREPRLSAAQKAFFVPFFEQCDLAKFADAPVPEATCDERWRQVCEFLSH